MTALRHRHNFSLAHTAVLHQLHNRPVRRQELHGIEALLALKKRLWKELTYKASDERAPDHRERMRRPSAKFSCNNLIVHFGRRHVLPECGRFRWWVAPIAAAVIAAEMLLFCALHLQSAEGSRGELIYWLVVVAICAFVAYGRFALKPL